MAANRRIVARGLGIPLKLNPSVPCPFPEAPPDGTPRGGLFVDGSAGELAGLLPPGQRFRSGINGMDFALSVFFAPDGMRRLAR